MSAQDAYDKEIHVWETAGIEEGSDKVPRWYILLAVALGVFSILYLVNYLIGAQPSSAGLK